MGPDDLRAVHAVELACFEQPWTLQMFDTEMHHNPVARYLLLEEEGQVIGFAGVHIVLDEGHITNIALLAAYRGRGLGRRLTAALMQYAANLGVRFMTLEVRVSNATAISLYESLGFIKVHVRRGYYEDTGEDAWLMVCDRMPQADPDFEEAETLRE